MEVRGGSKWELGFINITFFNFETVILDSEKIKNSIFLIKLQLNPEEPGRKRSVYDFLNDD